MEIKLGWRVFLDTNRKHKAERLTQKIFTTLGDNCNICDCEIYWKNPSWHELTFDQTIQAESLSKMVVQILNRISLLSCCWNLVLSVDFTEQNYDDLCGDTNTRISIPGVISMSFLVESGEDVNVSLE